MKEIITYILSHWLDWIFTALVAIIGMGYRKISVKLQAEQTKSNAIAEGVQSLLRESLISNYNRYQEKECCPIYAKESIKKVYTAYHSLGGNDVATELYKKLLAMPEERKDEEDGR